MFTNQISGQGLEVNDKQIQSDNVQRWFTSEFFYSQMDRAYFAAHDFS